MEEIVHVISRSYHVLFKLTLVDNFDVADFAPVVLPNTSTKIIKLLVSQLIRFSVDVLVRRSGP